MSQAVTDSSPAADVAALLRSFLRHLAAENKAPSTMATYAKAVDQLDAFLMRVVPDRAARVRPQAGHRFAAIPLVAAFPKVAGYRA
jgi:hypothetical protein